MSFDIRNIVLHRSLLVERNVTISLATILGISRENSKTLSNKNSSLSFKTKVDLLTDIQFLPRSDAKKFEYFMQIRNQFLHNYQVDTFIKCMKYIDGLENKLLKLYPYSCEDDDSEKKLISTYDLLFIDILKSLENLLKIINEKAYKKSYKQGKIEGYEIIVDSFREVIADLPIGSIILEDVYARAKKINNK